MSFLIFINIFIKVFGYFDLWVNILDVLEKVVNGMVKYFLFGFFKIGLSNI